MKKLLRYNNIFFILLVVCFLFSACGTQTTEEGGSVTIQSSPFSEIKTIAGKVKAYLEIGGKTCEFELDPDDTTLKDNQKCTDIPMGSHSYKIVYKYTETGVILANTEGTITLISGKDNEIYLAPPEKDIDDDGDGFKNFYEILQGTDPKDPGSKPVEDKTPPAVNSTNPANNSTNVPVNSKISATFSEAIDSKTITNETFTVSNGSTNIPGTVAINGTTATFTPSANLSYNTTYTAMINTGIKDLAGNTIAGNYSWSFVTEISAGTKPSVPTGVTAQAGDGQVTISWAAVSGATSYNIYWSTTANVSKSTGTKISNVKSPYNHTGITNGTTYRYVVTAVNIHGESGESDQTSATYTSVVTSDTTAPANTTGTNFINSGASASNSTSVTLSISATDSVGVTGYYASENSTTPSASDESWTSISSTTTYSAGVTFTLSNGDGEKTIYVWFKDAVGNVSSPVNDSITLATIPSAPTNVIPAASDAQATIRWDSVSNATSYNIYWLTTSGVTKSTGTKISNATSPYTHVGRTNGTAYYYVVTAVNDNGESRESVEVTVTPQAIVPLPETGQTTCNDSAGDVMACAGTGQDGELQRGVAWPNPRFTDNGDRTVTDKLTGLVWTKYGNVPGPSACSLGTIKTWQEAMDYVACLNTNSYLGYTDWRLPNVNELRSLVHAGQSNTATWLNTQGFNNVQFNYYWSSTSHAYYPVGAWIVDMWYGVVNSSSKSSPDFSVWPVRSGQSWLLGNSTIPMPKTGQTTCYDRTGNVVSCTGTGQDGDLQRGVAWPVPRFTDNGGDGTVTDNLTGLVWAKDGNAPGPVACTPAISKTWQAALSYVACLNGNSYLGYTDWRLPNVNELQSLVHAGQSNTATWLNTQGFNNVLQSDGYWSSTSSAGYAWVVGMNGYVFVNDISNSFYYAWPVRSGQ